MSEVISVGAIVVFLMLMFYMTMGIIIQRYKLSFGHEASYTILLGMLISFVAFEEGHREFVKMLKFSDSTFFFFLLPPIVFSSGYNMQRGNFFANIKNIMIFGVLSTFVCFTVFSVITIYCSNMDFMQVIDGKTGEWSKLQLTASECLLMCSLLCSSDVIAAVSLISYDKQPKLFSIVFGEGIINDAVSIILFNTVLKYSSSTTEVTASTPIAIMKDFFELGANSLLIGVFVGLFSAVIFKSYRAFSRNPIIETAMLFCFAYMAYVLSEIGACSGIISLLTSGIVMAHYTFYNLSAPGKHATYFVFEFLGYAAEAFVFGYLGLTFFSYFELKWSPELFCVELAVILIGRFTGVFLTIGLFKCCCGYKSNMTFKEMIFIWYAGMIRGAIAFGLVLRIDGEHYKNRDVIVTTSLSLVVFTTVVFGSTVGLLSKCLFPDEVEADETAIFDELTEGSPTKIKEMGKKVTINEEVENVSSHKSFHSSQESQSSSEHSGGHLHPNLAMDMDLQRRDTEAARVAKYRGLTKYMYIFDEQIMKPIFIYKYNRLIVKEAAKMFETYIDHGNEMERDFI